VVNGFWLRGQELGSLGGFFSLPSSSDPAHTSPSRDWSALRDRWEHSHVVRAVLWRG
jgi:hypothetical protein